MFSSKAPVGGTCSTRSHGHIHMEMRAVHRKEIERGEPNQRAGGHEIKIAGVSEGKVPEDDECRPQDGNKKL